MALTAEQIAERCDRYNGTANIAAINRYYRRQDCSRGFPVMGKFDVTERAIRRLRVQRQGGSGPAPGIEYAVALDDEIGRIVNALH